MNILSRFKISKYVRKHGIEAFVNKYGIERLLQAGFAKQVSDTSFYEVRIGSGLPLVLTSKGKCIAEGRAVTIKNSEIIAVCGEIDGEINLTIPKGVFTKDGKRIADGVSNCHAKCNEIGNRYHLAAADNGYLQLEKEVTAPLKGAPKGMVFDTNILPTRTSYGVVDKDGEMIEPFGNYFVNPSSANFNILSPYADLKTEPAKIFNTTSGEIITTEYNSLDRPTQVNIKNLILRAQITVDGKDRYGIVKLIDGKLVVVADLEFDFIDYYATSNKKGGYNDHDYLLGNECGVINIDTGKRHHIETITEDGVGV